MCEHHASIVPGLPENSDRLLDLAARSLLRANFVFGLTRPWCSLDRRRVVARML